MSHKHQLPLVQSNELKAQVPRGHRELSLAGPMGSLCNWHQVSTPFWKSPTSGGKPPELFLHRDSGAHSAVHISPSSMNGERIWHHATLLDGDKMEAVIDFIFLGSKITVDGDCMHEIKRHLLLGRKVITNLDNVLKSRDITLPTKFPVVKAMIFPVVKFGCESWTIKKAEH